MKKLLLTADFLVPVSSEPIRNGAVVVDGGRIVDIGTSGEIEAAYPDFQKIRKPNSIILPGFVNAHTHLELSWTKGKIRGFEDFTGWLERLITLKADGIDQGLMEDSMKTGLRDVIESGVTTVGEISSLDFGGREILKNSGMRIIAFLELFDRVSPRLPSLEFQSEDLYEKDPFRTRLIPAARSFWMRFSPARAKTRLRQESTWARALMKSIFCETCPTNLNGKSFRL